MSILQILKYPDPRLKEKAVEVKEITKEIKKLAFDMVETMYSNRGVGLAAPQVGVPFRIIVIDIDQLEKEPNPIICINPEIISHEGKTKDDEGCLSVPGFTAPVERYKKVVVSFLDLDGNSNEVTAEDFFAKAFQHEIDHLNGILFVDRLGRLRKQLFLKRYKKMMEESL